VRAADHGGVSNATRGSTERGSFRGRLGSRSSASPFIARNLVVSNRRADVFAEDATERPVIFEISSKEFPSLRSFWILARSTATGLRPNRRPLALAFRIPARTFSAVKTILPAGVAVSRLSDSETNSMPRDLKVSSARQVRNGTGEAIEFPARDHIASNHRLWASAIRRFNSGRESLAQDTPMSTYSRSIGILSL
jgi:hypothetical protein